LKPVGVGARGAVIAMGECRLAGPAAC